MNPHFCVTENFSSLKPLLLPYLSVEAPTTTPFILLTYIVHNQWLQCNHLASEATLAQATCLLPCDHNQCECQGRKSPFSADQCHSTTMLSNKPATCSVSSQFSHLSEMEQQALSNFLNHGFTSSTPFYDNTQLYLFSLGNNHQLFALPETFFHIHIFSPSYAYLPFILEATT